MNYVFCSSAASSAVMLLVGWYESHPAVKILGVAMLAVIYVELNDMHMFHSFSCTATSIICRSKTQNGLFRYHLLWYS